jgi:hypothetical protein
MTVIGYLQKQYFFHPVPEGERISPLYVETSSTHVFGNRLNAVAKSCALSKKQ